MRKIVHCSVWFDSKTKERVLELMKIQCSATRSAYQAIHKHGLKNNAVRLYVKKNYMADLNQRYINDACSLADRIVFDRVVFGGKKAWGEQQTGKITIGEWQERRNSQLYSAGDKTLKGNPNIRLLGNKLLVNDPAVRGLWLSGSVFVPKKFKPNLTCYEVRLIHDHGKFRVVLSWEEEAPKIQTDRGLGAVGVDTNVDGFAVTATNSVGCLTKQHYKVVPRLQSASTNKSDNDIRLAAKAVVSEAKEQGKPLVVETLEFGRPTKGKRKLGRFANRRLLDAIKQRAVKEGVEVIEVNPAFSSVLGDLKYKQMYSLGIHNAAALVIARRGLGLKERQDFRVTQDESTSKTLNLEGRGVTRRLTRKAYSFLEERFLKEKPATLTASGLAAGSKPAKKPSVGETPASEPSLTTGRRREMEDFFRNSSAEERQPCELGDQYPGTLNQV